jgi:hypothetical protein
VAEKVPGTAADVEDSQVARGELGLFENVGEALRGVCFFSVLIGRQDLSLRVGDVIGIVVDFGAAELREVDTRGDQPTPLTFDDVVPPIGEVRGTI